MTENQKLLLNEPLDKNAVKQRKQGSAMVDYIDGHHAISEANRIFDFDGWSYTVDDLRLIQDEERANSQGIRNWNCGYLARVTVNVGGVTRQDYGAGNGIDKNPFQAHESASKEAVTDALKRCLRTFGSTFGLALYDKTRKNVGKKNNTKEMLQDEMTEAQLRIQRCNQYYGLLEWQGQEKKENTEKIKALAKKNGSDWIDELEMACKDMGLL